MHQKIEIENSAKWCILRTSPGRTIGLANSLAEKGFEVWTPIRTESRRRPRSKIRVERDAPIIPTFVFARDYHVADLLEVVAMPLSPHPQFSIFRHAGRIPLISDKEVSFLRTAEDRAKLARRKEQRIIIPIGSKVRVTEGVGLGMTGVVEGAHGKFATVHFGGDWRLKIATWILQVNEVGSALPKQGAAARAA